MELALAGSFMLGLDSSKVYYFKTTLLSCILEIKA